MTGNGWAFPIDMAEARITLPEKVPFRQTAIYTGPQGATGKDATRRRAAARPHRVPHHAPAAAAKRPHRRRRLAEGRGRAADRRRSSRAIGCEDNRGLVIAVIGLALLLAYYAFAWLSVGRDPPIGTIIPLFAPPDGMSPAATRYVDRMSFDNRLLHRRPSSISASRVICRSSKTTTRPRLKKRSGGKPLAPEEQALMTSLFRDGDSVLLDQVNHVPHRRGQERIGRGPSKAYLGKLFANNFGWSGSACCWGCWSSRPCCSRSPAEISTPSCGCW